MRCSFCNKSQNAVAKLISSPSDYPRAYICDQCVRLCSAAIPSAPKPPGHRSVNTLECSFCKVGADMVRLFPSLGDPPKALICEQCLEVCMSIFEDDDSPPPGLSR